MGPLIQWASQNWLGQSLTATMLLVVAWPAIPFFERNFGIRIETFSTIYFLGIVSMYAMTSGSKIYGQVIGSTGSIALIFMVGVIFGGIANLLLFRAVAGAPNPGLPVAISCGAAIGTAVVAWGLAKVAPNWFGQVDLNWKVALGIMLMLSGVALVATR